eukprot:14354605-Alexandrium_andersonii.AAC.1
MNDLTHCACGETANVHMGLRCRHSGSTKGSRGVGPVRRAPIPRFHRRTFWDGLRRNLRSA